MAWAPGSPVDGQGVLAVARVVAWVVVACASVALLAQPGGPLGPSAFAASHLTVTGDVEGLAPGVASPLTLTVGNPGDEPVVVHRLTARATSGGTPACGPERLVATAWSGALTVPARGTAEAALTLLVPDDRACDGQTWSLAYTAS